MGQGMDLLRACKRLQGLWYELPRDSEVRSIRIDSGNPGRCYGVKNEAETEGAMELIPNPSWAEKVNLPAHGDGEDDGWDMAMYPKDGGKDGWHHFHQPCAHGLIHHAKPDR